MSEIVSMETINVIRGMLPTLQEAKTVLGEDGVRYTFCPPRAASGCVIDFYHSMHSYGGHWSGNANRWLTRGFLWPLEQMVYYQERSRIIAQVLRELPRSAALGPKNPEKTWEFLQEFNRALQATEEKWRLPKPKSTKKMQIKRISDYWWLFHRSWMPLCFDTFEEAADFAKRYVVRKAA